MRKYKQVKEKKVTYDLDEWEEVERRARKMKMKTGTYIKRISVDGKVEYCDLGDIAPLVKEVNAIGVNVNQIAHKANELNSIYAGDFEKMKELMEIPLLLNNLKEDYPDLQTDMIRTKEYI